MVQQAAALFSAGTCELTSGNRDMDGPYLPMKPSSLSTFVLVILGFLVFSTAVGLEGAITDSFTAVYLLSVALLIGTGLLYWLHRR